MEGRISMKTSEWLKISFFVNSFLRKYEEKDEMQWKDDTDTENQEPGTLSSYNRTIGVCNRCIPDQETMF